jgi:hypothetical protein
MLRCPSRGTLEEAICLAVHSGAASSGSCFPDAASFRGLCGSILSSDRHERDAEPAEDFDKNPDADQEVEDGEDLHPPLVEHEIRVGNASRRQRRYREVERVHDVPPSPNA